MTTLLDANVLISLLAARHVHHERAWTWFGDSRRFATCAIVQMSFVRFALRGGLPVGDALVALASLTERPRHTFWDDPLAIDSTSMRGVVGHRQVTDFHLAALARHHGGRLATIDEGLANAHADVVELVP